MTVAKIDKVLQFLTTIFVGTTQMEHFFPFTFNLTLSIR